MPRNTKPYLKGVLFCDGEAKLLNSLRPIVEATQMIAEETINRCEDAGLLPIPLIEGLQMLAFVVRSVVAAQRAQRAYGVPSSYLIAMAAYEFSWDAAELENGIDEWFLERAWRLATTKKFMGAMPFAEEVSAYARKLCELGFRDLHSTEDLLSYIEQFRLGDCDIAAILPPGQYHKTVFDVVRDDAGRIQLKPLIDVREFRTMRSTSALQMAAV